MLVHRAWESRDESGRTRRVFPLDEYRGETLGEKAANALKDARNQSAPSARIVPLYSNDGATVPDADVDALSALLNKYGVSERDFKKIWAIAFRAAGVE
jgi:hypothetical protein